MQRINYMQPRLQVDSKDINDLTRQFEASAITSTQPTSDMNPTHPSTLLETTSTLPTELDSDAHTIMQTLFWQQTHRNEHATKGYQLAVSDSFNNAEYIQDMGSNEEQAVSDEVEEENMGSDDEDDVRSDDESDDVMMEDATYTCDESKKNEIMQADVRWTVPPNFKTDWVMVVCPAGTRCLVTTWYGQTVTRSVDGRIINRFQSNLPNGSIYQSHPPPNCCILDCIYDTIGIFYILDVMCWKGISLYETSTTSRHQYMKANLCFTSAPSKYIFKLLEQEPMGHLDKVIMDFKQHNAFSNHYNVAGLLFYHRESEYVGGTTPLMRWLPLDRISSLQNLV